MSQGFVLNIPMEMLDRLDTADKKIEQLATTSENASKRIVNAFQEMGSKGIMAFIENLNKAQQSLNSLGKGTIEKMFQGVSNSATQGADAVNRMTESIAKATSAKNQNISNSAIAKINIEIEESIKKLDVLQERLKYYTKGEGAQAGMGWVDTSADQAQANALMQRIQLLEQERKQLIENARVRLSEAQRLDAYEQKKLDLERKKREDARKTSEEYNRQIKQRTEEEKKQYTERQRLYKQLFKQIEAREKKEQAAAEKAIRDAERQRKALEKAERDRIKTPTELFDMRGSMQSLQQLQNYVRELKRTMDTLNPNTLEWQKLNKIYGETQVRIRGVKREMEGANEKQRELINTGDQLKRAFSLMFSVSAIKGYISQIVRVRGEMELQQRSLQALLQNKDAADKIWEQTMALALKSPFQIKELVTYTKQLAAYRVESEKLFDTTKMLADVSAGLGVDMQRLILAYGQVKAAAYLRGTELRQFSEAGINMLGELSKYFSEIEGRAVTTGEVFERISKRMVVFADVEEIFRRITSEGGIFYQMQEKQAETLKGQVSNLRDSIDIMLNEIGTEQDSTLKDMVSKMRLLIENWREVEWYLSKIIVSFGAYKGIMALNSLANTTFVAGLVNMTKWLKDADTATALFGMRLGMTEKVALKFGKAFAKIASVGIAGVLIGVAVAIFEIWRRATKTTRELRRLNKELDKLLSEDKANLDKQIRGFDNLINRLKLVNKGSKEHKDIIASLNQNYGEYLGFIVNEATTYDELASNIDSVTQALVNKAKMASYEKAYSKVLETTNEQISDAQKILRDTLISGGLEKGGVKIIPTEKEINDIFGLYEKKVKETGEYGISVLKTVLKEYGDFEYVDYFGREGIKLDDYGIAVLKQKEEELKLQEKINNTHGQGIAMTAEHRRELEALDKAQKEELKNATTKREKDEVRRKYAIELIKLNGRFQGLNDDAINKQIDAYEKKTKTVIDVNNKISQSVEELGQKYADMIYIDDEQAQKSVSQIADEAAGRYEEAQKTIKEQNALKEAGTVYDEQMLDNAQKTAAAYKYLLEVLGRTDLLEKKGTKEKTNKILSRRIQLIQDMYKKYKELSKLYSSEEAEKQIINAYSKTWDETFQGTGISLYKFIPKKKAEEEGKEVMSAFSEGMAAEMNKMAETNFFVRMYSDSLKERIKREEGLVLQAYDDATGKILKKGEQAKGTITIGYGTTAYNSQLKVQAGDTITLAEAEKYLTDTLDDRANALNRILDANKDLIITQEQYDVLLDMMYQGGSASVRWLIERAKNEEKGVEHIKRIYEKVKETMGETVAERFGAAFVDQFLNAESVVERMALLLQTMNLTTVASGSKVDKRLYNNMQGRSDRRSANFSGSLSTAKEIEKVLIRIANLDITTPEGIVAALEQLKPIAEKEGQEAVNALNKTISGFKAEVGLEIRKDSLDNMVKDIDTLLNKVDITNEFKDLGLSEDFAKRLFNFDFTNLDEVAERIKNMKNEFEQYGTEGVEAWDKAMEKVNDLQDKALKERIKNYHHYLLEIQRDAVRIKMDELRQLQEIEQSKYSDAEKKIMKDRVKENTKQLLDSAAWSDFKGSEMYTMMFEDLEYYGTQALENLRDKLGELRESLKDLPANEVKEIIRQMERINEITLERNPFKELKEQRVTVKATGVSEEEAIAQAATSQANIDNLQKELDIINTVTIAREKGLAIDKETLSAYNEIVNVAKEQGIVETELADKKGKALTKEQKSLEIAIKTVQEHKKLRNTQNAALQRTNDILGEVNNAVQASIELMEALGVSGDSIAGILVNSISSMISLTMSAIQFQIQLQAMGVVANSALGIIGWIAIAIQAVATAIAAIFKAKDKALQNQIDALAKSAEVTQESFDKLANSIDEIYSSDALAETNKEMEQLNRNLIANLKAQKSLQQERKQTDEVKEEIENLNDAILEAEQAIVDAQKDVFSHATDGILDSAMDAARGFVDAWADAYAETGNGMKGLEENFEEMLMNMAKQQAAQQIVGLFAQQWKEDLEKYIGGDDMKLTKEEAQAWAEEVRRTFPELNAALEGYLGAIMDNIGGGSLSGLEEGIAGASEETVQVVAAYLNSIRFFVAENNAVLKQLRDYQMGTEDEVNPMLAQLRIIARQTGAIYTLLDSVTRVGHPQGGSGIRVFMD